MRLTIEAITTALTRERDFIAKGLCYVVTEARREGSTVVANVEPHRSLRSSAIDESLEGCRATWGDDFVNRGEVLFVDAEAGALVLRFVTGDLPSHETPIWLFPRDFLTPLIELWQIPDRRGAIGLIEKSRAPKKQLEPKTLPQSYSVLRQRQVQAVDIALQPKALLLGPPGTGKTFTVGAIIATLLSRYKNSRILLVGPTNVAVDTALLAADDWLKRIGKPELASHMKRIGSRFDPKKYAGRDHLLARGVYEAATALALLELDEPPKAQIEKYAKWKEQVEKARAALKTDILAIGAQARVLAVTTTSAFMWYEAITACDRWDFVISDEASQVMLPAALMIAGAGRRILFAGDPHQLAPVVQSKDTTVQALLTKTAFDLEDMPQVQLNEQSRMCQEICETVSKTFYDDGLTVCSKARHDKTWQLERSPYFVDGRQLPRVFCETIEDNATWSAKYNGFIRYKSAELTIQLVSELLGSYADERDILVLTPFRAQRALMRAFCKTDSLRRIRISTVHRAQGSEAKFVLFDPVDANGNFLNSPNGRRLINVAVSRAQAHAVLFINKSDLGNPWIDQIRKLSMKWHTAGDYAEPFSIQ
jgi:superfamily I DNA and/or RNA helicase